MNSIKVKCPAKINLTLEILNKREDGFHNIQSVMQTINLFDILTISIENKDVYSINLSGTSNEIPYNEKNLVYKAVMLYFKNKPNCKINIHIEKNIPIAAGLAGGSTDAAGTLWGLNEIFKYYDKKQLHNFCAQLGSDLNFCLEGGCQLTTGRGEILKKLPFKEFELSLIKPINLGISAKEAYTKYAELENKPKLDMTTKLVNGENIEKCLYDDLETAVFSDYKELQQIKAAYPSSIMSGSGSTYFVLDGNICDKLDETFWIKTGLKSISYGVCQY